MRTLPFVLLTLATTAAAFAAPPQAHLADKVPDHLAPLPAYLGGRSLQSGDDSISQWPGFYARTAFSGSSVFFRLGPSHQILHLTLDNKPLPPLTEPTPGLYTLDHLPNGPHTLTLATATESQSSPNTFAGFFVSHGTHPLPIAGYRRQIEFIGDSHTVGYGNTSPTTHCSEDEVWSTTDNTRSFGPLVAAHYEADYQINAISGRGVVRNYNGLPSPTLPQAYPFTLFDQKQPYTNPAWQPQVIVVALGTNDFTTALHPGEPWATRPALHADYEHTYTQFLTTLRTAHPHALIIVWATSLADGEIEDEAGKVVEQLRTTGGDKGIHFLPFDHLEFSACNGHPSLADDKEIAARLITLIDSQPDPWTPR